MSPQERLEQIELSEKNAPIRVQTFGSFTVWLDGEEISSKVWGRDKTVQLFQFFVSNRNRRALHKEQIMDRLWEDYDDRDFKVALHGINKVLEPNRAARTEPKYIERQGVTYWLDLNEVWIDAEALDKLVTLGNELVNDHQEIAKQAYKNAVGLYHGAYLPNRIYDDWTAEEREKSRQLALSAYNKLAELELSSNPTESLRLAQNVLSIDPCWENAYRIQMQAHTALGNRPQAIKTYKNCESVLKKEYGIEPLPQTKQLLKEIQEIG